jgi:carbamoyl-phosphate synthase large subunit
MSIVYSAGELRHYLQHAVEVSPDSPVLLDRFLEDAIEVDVDAICDGQDVLIGGIMEHIEQAGIHSGDSSCTLPPYSLSSIIQAELGDQIAKIARKLKVVGLINAQFAIKGDDIYVLEVNPRASRTIPFVSKAVGAPLAKIAAKCIVGESLRAQGYQRLSPPHLFAIKQAVFPFEKFPGEDPVLGPEMKSTGEVMGIDRRFGGAFAKGQLGMGARVLSTDKQLRAFLSVRDEDKTLIAEIAKLLRELGFEIIATRGTARVIEAAGVPCSIVNKVWEGRPNIVDKIKNDEISFIVNTTQGRKSSNDSSSMRRNALLHKISYTTTVAGAKAACMAMRYANDISIIKLQDLR